jgi:hypothetical protein
MRFQVCCGECRFDQKMARNTAEQLILTIDCYLPKYKSTYFADAVANRFGRMVIWIIVVHYSTGLRVCVAGQRGGALKYHEITIAERAFSTVLIWRAVWSGFLNYENGSGRKTGTDDMAQVYSVSHRSDDP